MRTRLPIGVIAFLLSATFSSSIVGQQDPVAPAISTEQKLLKSFPKTVLDTELKAARGGSFRLSDYSGKVLVVTLWATWANPCRLMIPSLVKFTDEFRMQGMEVIGLSTENPEMSAEAVSEIIRAYKVNYQIGWAPPEVSTILMQEPPAIPQTYVISRSGRIVKRFVGFNPTATPPLLKQAIEEAFNEKTDRPKQN